MNGRKAKRLRKEAQGMTKGLPLASYRGYTPPYFQYELGVPKKTVPGTPRVLIGDCTRSVCQKMKRSAHV